MSSSSPWQSRESLGMEPVQRHGGNTARLACTSDEALEVRGSVARIAPSLLDLGRGGGGPIPLLSDTVSDKKVGPNVSSKARLLEMEQCAQINRNRAISQVQRALDRRIIGRTRRLWGNTGFLQVNCAQWEVELFRAHAPAHTHLHCSWLQLGPLTNTCRGDYPHRTLPDVCLLLKELPSPPTSICYPALRHHLLVRSFGEGPRGIMSEGAADQRVFSVISRFDRPCVPELLRTHLASPSSAVKTSMLRARPNLFTHSLTRGCFGRKYGHCPVLRFAEGTFHSRQCGDSLHFRGYVGGIAFGSFDRAVTNGSFCIPQLCMACPAAALVSSAVEQAVLLHVAVLYFLRVGRRRKPEVKFVTSGLADPQKLTLLHLSRRDVSVFIVTFPGTSWIAENVLDGSYLQYKYHNRASKEGVIESREFGVSGAARDGCSDLRECVAELVCSGEWDCGLDAIVQYSATLCTGSVSSSVCLWTHADIEVVMIQLAQHSLRRLYHSFTSPGYEWMPEVLGGKTGDGGAKAWKVVNNAVARRVFVGTRGEKDDGWSIERSTAVLYFCREVVVNKHCPVSITIVCCVDGLWRYCATESELACDASTTAFAAVSSSFLVTEGGALLATGTCRLYGATGCSAKKAALMYRGKFSNMRHPNCETLISVDRNVRETRSFHRELASLLNTYCPLTGIRGDGVGSCGIQLIDSCWLKGFQSKIVFPWFLGLQARVLVSAMTSWVIGAHMPPPSDMCPVVRRVFFVEHSREVSSHIPYALSSTWTFICPNTTNKPLFNTVRARVGNLTHRPTRPAGFSTNCQLWWLRSVWPADEQVTSASVCKITVEFSGAPFHNVKWYGLWACAVDDKVNTFEINLRRKSLPLTAYILTGALGDKRPVKLVTKDGKSKRRIKRQPPRVRPGGKKTTAISYGPPFNETRLIPQKTALLFLAAIISAANCVLASAQLEETAETFSFATLNPARREDSNCALKNGEEEKRYSFFVIEQMLSRLCMALTLQGQYRLFTAIVLYIINRPSRGRGSVVVRLPAFHLGKPGSNLGFSLVEVVPDDAAGRWVFSVISRFPPALAFRRCSKLTSLDKVTLSRPRLNMHIVAARKGRSRVTGPLTCYHLSYYGQMRIYHLKCNGLEAYKTAMETNPPAPPPAHHHQRHDDRGTATLVAGAGNEEEDFTSLRPGEVLGRSTEFCDENNYRAGS
ncbi:hypothetical protein PR048_007195 [Dryococelus australis]|uniref:Uncharacterized protein n=1 Tax=Dryococelus australis TaxID=614101 RepID=A0ABQ9ID01_9NEOP|nr:hypothetical protein PR048_007195 [Dryococelus australis]